MLPIVLASSSSYRRALLGRLGINFHWDSPDIDETALEHESGDHLVARLAQQKAQALRAKYPHALIIGSDQVAVLGNQIIGKPHSYQPAFEQLKKSSGQAVTFKTGLCLLNTATGQHQIAVEEFKVHFCTLSDAQIQYYLEFEQPYDCAGSFKCEGLGIALFKKLSGDDPNTLIGLPLIRLIEMLRNEGVDPLAANT